MKCEKRVYRRAHKGAMFEGEEREEGDEGRCKLGEMT